MKNKKGFTLIELLVTIALMLSILGIAIVSFINISNRKKEEAYKLVTDQIMTAAEQYFESNAYLFEGLENKENSIGIITVGKLVGEDYLNKVTDPRDGKTINYCNQIQVKKENGVYKSTYQETEETNCPDTINSVIVSEPGAPSVVISLEGTSGENNWYKSDVNLKATTNTNKNGAITSVERCESEGNVSCTDFSSLSEIKKEYTEKVEDTNQTTIGYKVTNISGKSAMDWKTLKVDTKKPTINTYIENENNWIKNNAKYGYKVTDNLSGIDKITIYWNVAGRSEKNVNDCSWDGSKNKYKCHEKETDGHGEINGNGQASINHQYNYTLSAEG